RSRRFAIRVIGEPLALPALPDGVGSGVDARALRVEGWTCLDRRDRGLAGPSPALRLERCEGAWRCGLERPPPRRRARPRVQPGGARVPGRRCGGAPLPARTGP